MAKNPLSIIALMAVSSLVAACDIEVTVVEHTGKAGVVDTMDGEGGSGPATGSTTTASVSSSTVATTTVASSSSSGGGGALPAAIFQLAGNPVSGVIVKKQQSVPVVAITIVAGNEDITVPSVTLTSQAEIAGSGCSFGEQCAHEAASTRMLSLSLWDGVTQVGNAKAPDPATGKAQITGMSLLIPANMTKTLTVKSSFGSGASPSPYDHVAVGIEEPYDIVVLDESQQSVLGSLEPQLQEQAYDAPSVVQELRPEGQLEIESYATPVSTIVVAGKDVWVPFAQFHASALYEAATIDRLSTSMVSVEEFDTADVTQVAVASGGVIHGTAVMSASGTVDVDLSQDHLTIPQDGVLTFQLWAKLAPVVSRNINPAPSGVARSGHAFGLTLTDGLTTGEWDSAYSGNLNVRTTGQSSGERLYAANGSVWVNPMVVRKTKPTVTKQNLASTTLANIDMDLIKFQVAADAAGAVELKQVMFNFAMTPGVTLSNFRVRRGATDMSLSNYSVVFQNGADLEAGSLASNGTVVMAFTNDETIVGSGNVYTLHANVSGASAGKSVSIVFNRDAFMPIITGSLINNASYGLFASSSSIFQLDEALSGGRADAIGTFLWRDGSEPVGVQIDYTTDAFIEDLAQSQTLSL